MDLSALLRSINATPAAPAGVRGPVPTEAPRNAAGLAAPTFSAEGLNIFDPVPQTRTGSLVGNILGNETLRGNTFDVRDVNTRDYGNAADPNLNAMLNAAGTGRARTGVAALLGDQYSLGGEMDQDTGQRRAFNVDPLVQLANQTGFDVSQYDLDPANQSVNGQRNRRGIEALYSDLDKSLGDVATIQGMSGQWTGRPEERSATETTFRRVGNQLVPITAPREYIQRETGGGLLQDQEFMAAMSVAMPAIGALFAAPAAAGAGASTAATTGGAAAGGAATSTTLAQQAANMLGLGAEWSSLPAWGQRAITGALQNGVMSGLQGGNVLTGALSGGISGGAGSLGSSYLSGLGLPDWASQGLSRAVTGGLSSAIRGGDALTGALAGGISGGLSGAGLPSSLANAGGGVLAGLLNSEGASSGSPAAASSSMASGSSLPRGSSTSGQLFNPDIARQRYLVNALRLNRDGRAGDQSQDRASALERALEEITG